MVPGGLEAEVAKECRAKCRRCVEEPGPRAAAVTLMRKEEVARALTASAGESTRVAGDEIAGDDLRELSGEPILTVLAACQLRDAEFTSDCASPSASLQTARPWLSAGSARVT